MGKKFQKIISVVAGPIFCSSHKKQPHEVQKSSRNIPQNHPRGEGNKLNLKKTAKKINQKEAMKKWKWYCNSWIFSLFLMNFLWISFLTILSNVIFIFFTISCKYKKGLAPRTIYNSLLRTFVWRIRLSLVVAWKNRTDISIFLYKEGGGFLAKRFTLGDYLHVKSLSFTTIL